MAHKDLREKATQLRLQGYTYSQIKLELKIPRSTLSDWLCNLTLSPNHLKLLSKNKNLAASRRIEKYRETTQNKRKEKLKKILNKQENELLPLSERELFIAGLFLFWGEGSKQRGRVVISNSNPLIIQFAKHWMIKSLNVSEDRITVRLHLYKDMNIEENINYWAEILSLPKKQFKKPYIKKTNREGLTYKSYGRGTCNLMYFDAALSEKIAMSIKCIAESCGAKNDLFWYN